MHHLKIRCKYSIRKPDLSRICEVQCIGPIKPLYCICLVGIKWAPTRQNPLRRQRNMFDTRIKIMLEEQLVDPRINYKTSANVP